MSLWAWITYPFRRQPRRPLSYRQPERAPQSQVPLGMEAIDMDVVNAAHKANARLERTSNMFSRNRFGSFTETADLNIAPLADDETYAARFHRAYNRKGNNYHD